MQMPDWSKIKILFTPFFILFYIFLIICWYNRVLIINFLKSVFYGTYGYSGGTSDYFY